MIERFEKWLEESKEGDIIVYLQADYAGRRPKIQEFFWNASSDGKVFLYQVRVTEGVYNYCARRISNRAGKALRPWEYPSCGLSYED